MNRNDLISSNHKYHSWNDVIRVTPKMDKFRDRPARLHLTAEQVNDLRGADVLLPNRPDEIKEVIRERGCDSNQIRLSLAERNITACIPPAKKRKSKRPYNWHLYKKRHPIENMRAKRKDWRRKATRYDRCTHTFIVRNPHRSKRHLLPQRMNAEPNHDSREQADSPRTCPARS